MKYRKEKGIQYKPVCGLMIVIAIMLTLLCNTRSVMAAAKEETGETTDIKSYTKQISSEPAVLVSEDIVAVVSYGINQVARYGRELQLKVTVYNKVQTINGSVSAVIINQGQDNVEYETQSVFTGGEKTEVVLMLPMNQATESLCIKIHNETKTVVEATIPLNIWNFGTYYLVGILDQSVESLSYFESFGNKVVSLTESNFPCDISGLDILDVIVVNDFNLDQLSKEQLQTLIAWVKNGGNLVLGIDNDTLSNIELMNQYEMIELKQPINYEDQDTIQFPIQLMDTSEFNSVLSRINDYEYMRNRIIQYVESTIQEDPQKTVNIYMGNPMLGTKTINDIKNLTLRKRVTQFDLVVQDYLNDNRNDQIRLYDKVSLGKGIIQIYHFGLENPKLTSASLSLYNGVQGELLSGAYCGIAARVLVNLSATTKNMVSMQDNMTTGSYRINDFSATLNSMQIPTVGRYVVLLVIYILLIGPILRIILKKAKKQQLIWITIPALSLVFIAIIYLAGTQTRITSPFVSYIDLELYDPQNHQIEGSIYTNISIPTKNNHSLILSGAMKVKSMTNNYPDYYATQSEYTASQQDFYDYTFSDRLIQYSEDGAYLTIGDNTAFSNDAYLISYEKENTENLKSELNVSATEISGSITNTLSLEFEDAVIYCNGIYIGLGEVKEGDVIDIDQAPKVFAMNTDSLYYSVNAISRMRGTDTEEGILNNTGFINTMGMIYDTYLKNQDQAYFIGIKKNVSADSPIYELSKAKASRGMAAVIIPLDVSYDQGQSTFVPSIDRYLVTDDSLLWDEEYRISYLNSLELSYHFPEDEKISSIILSDQFSEKFEDDSYDRSTLRLYFYNYGTEKYDLLFDLDSDYTMRSVSEDELKPYINLKNEMKVKYEIRNTDDSTLIIPIISCLKEVQDAQD